MSDETFSITFVKETFLAKEDIELFDAYGRFILTLFYYLCFMRERERERERERGEEREREEERETILVQKAVRKSSCNEHSL